MDQDSLRAGRQIIRNFVIKPTRICCRSVYNHPILVGFFLVLFYLYRSFPLLFQLLVSASPVVVCTAVLLGTLLSYGDNTTISTLIDEDDEKHTLDITELKPDGLGSRNVVERSLGEDSEYTELSSEVVKRSFEEEPLLDFSSMERSNEYDGNFREINFGKFSTDDEINEIGVGSSHVILERANSENFEDCKSVEESTDGKMSNMNGVLKDFAHEHYEIDENSPIRDRLETPTGSCTQFDNFEDYISGEGSVDAQIGSPLELSLGSWNHLDSDRDVDDEESDSGSDGAESSSPDASLADIIPMLDELHPLLEDENPHTGNHSTDESDQHEEEEVGDDENEEEDENQGGKEDEVKSLINWTEEDQKNMMELGTSDLERNQRLESLIARRRARRMVSERNLLDLEGMDLSFPIAPISTARYNPFDNNHDSYGDMGLPPIPGSAPSIMVKRQNPFDLPYDLSEEKPDLTGDSFQEEFMEINQRELGNQRLFKRNETFSVGSSSIFDFGRQTTRASRFRPYFIPERTDSDVMSYSSFERQLSEVSESRMSYSSLQRQSSEVSESKASSTPSDHESVQETGLSRGIGHPSDYMGNGSQSEDVHSISDEGNDEKDIDHDLPGIELIGVGDSPSASSEVDDQKGKDDDRVHHSKEAIYDSSPLAMKRNSSSSSSISSDLQRKTSDIDLYHVQRDLFAEDESTINVHSPEEFGQVNSVDEKVQEPEDNIISSLLENDESFSKHDTTDNINISVSDLAVENNVRELFVADELTMDEELLSELDAVGDFSVNNISLSPRRSYANDEVSSSIHFGVSTSLSDTTDVENLKSDLNHVWGKESISDSHVGDISAGLLGLEDQLSEKVEGIIVNEPDLSLNKEPINEDTNVNDLNLARNEKSIPDSSIGNAEVEHQSDRDINAGIMEELEAAYIKSELPMETTELMSLIETTLSEKESIPEISERSRVLREGEILDSSIVEPNLENSVNTDISETTTKPGIESDDDLQDSANVETVISLPVELGDKLEKSGFIDDKMMVNSIEPGYQMETVGSTGSELMQKDGDFKGTPELPVLDSSTESETLTVNLETDEILERSVEGSFAQASESEHQIEAEESRERESEQIQKVGNSEINTKEISEPPITEASIESEDLREIYSLMDNLVALQQKPENDVSKSGDSEEIHVGDDSVAQGSKMGAIEKSISLSMIKEEREPHDSHLEFSSSSSSNSSSSDSDDH